MDEGFSSHDNGSAGPGHGGHNHSIFSLHGDQADKTEGTAEEDGKKNRTSGIEEEIQGRKTTMKEPDEHPGELTKEIRKHEEK